MIAVIMGSGDWSDQTGEEIRHTFGNCSRSRKCIKISLTRKFLARVNKKSTVKNTMSKKMSTPQSKKAKTLKSIVKDDQIVIDNGLKPVSPKIKATSVKATKVKGWFDFGSNQKDKKATQSNK